MAKQRTRMKNDATQDFSSIRLPSDLVETIKQKLGDEFLWTYDSETKEMFIIKRPSSITEAMYGLGAEMWKKAGGADYIRKERDSWAD